jgi:hypothetical protein
MASDGPYGKIWIWRIHIHLRPMFPSEAYVSIWGTDNCCNGFSRFFRSLIWEWNSLPFHFRILSTCWRIASLSIPNIILQTKSPNPCWESLIPSWERRRLNQSYWVSIQGVPDILLGPSFCVRNPITKPGPYGPGWVILFVPLCRRTYFKLQYGTSITYVYV